MLCSLERVFCSLTCSKFDQTMGPEGEGRGRGGGGRVGGTAVWRSNPPLYEITL